MILYKKWAFAWWLLFVNNGLREMSKFIRIKEQSQMLCNFVEEIDRLVIKLTSDFDEIKWKLI